MLPLRRRHIVIRWQRCCAHTPIQEEGRHGGAPLAVLLEPVRLEDATRLRRGAVRRLALICRTEQSTA